MRSLIVLFTLTKKAKYQSKSKCPKHDWEKVPEECSQAKKSICLSRFFVHISLERFQSIRDLEPMLQYLAIWLLLFKQRRMAKNNS